jgi:hypothetical protein
MDTIKIDNSTDTRDLFESSFDFWFSGHSTIPCPFPEHMKEELKEKTFALFSNWYSKLRQKQRDSLSDSQLVEKYERILFAQAYALAKTEDEKISILYPYLPKVGEALNVTSAKPGLAKSIILERKIEQNALKIFLKNLVTGQLWNTRLKSRAMLCRFN